MREAKQHQPRPYRFSTARKLSCALITLVGVLVGGCASGHLHPSNCRSPEIDATYSEVRGSDKETLMAELQSAIAAASARKPRYQPEYRQFFFRSKDRAVLCQLGPCLPVRWIFEKRDGGWKLLNNPEGLCVA